MKLDILVFAAHPDDAELGCGGAIISHVEAGKKVGVVDMTKGEMGTRGTPEIRLQEANDAGKIMGLSIRENLGLADAFFENNKQNQLALVEKIRLYKPDIVLANAVSDRHPDHGKASLLATKACFLAGLKKLETTVKGEFQQAWRPKAVYHYIQSNYIEPDFIVDVSDSWEKKMEAIGAFKSQFYDPNNTEPETFISSKQFMQLVESRAIEYGKSINVKYAEGFTVERNIGVNDFFDLI